MMANKKMKVIVSVLIVLLLGGNGGLVTSFAATENNDKQISSLNDPNEVATFVNQKMTENLKKFNVPGAVISIVKGGKLLFSSGYGETNSQEKKKVSAESSMFRIASTTKLFTWTAVMQLVEQGKIDLDADVNTYLTKMKVPDTYEKPITMRNLMTHTAGFEEGGVGYQITLDESKLPGSI